MTHLRFMIKNLITATCFNLHQSLFYVLLTVHLSMILVINLMHKFFYYNKFIIFLYMFQALLCSSS